MVGFFKAQNLKTFLGLSPPKCNKKRKNISLKNSKCYIFLIAVTKAQPIILISITHAPVRLPFPVAVKLQDKIREKPEPGDNGMNGIYEFCK